MVGIDDAITILVSLLTFTLLVQRFGILYGLLGLIGIIKGKELVLKYVFKLDPLCCMDYLFLHDSKQSRANILGCYVYDKFEFETVKEHFKRKAFQFPRMKQRLRKFMASFYWEDIPEAEFKKMEDDLFINLKDEDIHNEKQLGEFLSFEI